MSRLVSAQTKWQRIIKQQQVSGLTVTAFCRREVVPVSSFYAWKQRLAGRLRGPAAFVAVKTIDDAGGDGDGGIELRLARGWRVILRRGFDHAVLREVLDVLEGQA